jgi:hypothetical protein
MANKLGIRGIRGISDDALWKETVRMAKQRDEDHGVFVERALRRERDALREPIAGEIIGRSKRKPPAPKPKPAASWPEAPKLSLVEVEIAFRLAQAFADLREGDAKGKIPEWQRRRLKAAFEQALGRPPEPAARKPRLLPPRPPRAIAAPAE